MKVDHPLSVPFPQIAGKRRAFKKGPAAPSPAFSTEALAGTAASFPLEMTPALLDFQGTLCAKERRREGIKKGLTLLDLLSHIQGELLSGTLSPSWLPLLRDLHNLPDQDLDEPALKDLLEEITLRSLVVLTQLERAFQKRALP